MTEDNNEAGEISEISEVARKEAERIQDAQKALLERERTEKLLAAKKAATSRPRSIGRNQKSLEHTSSASEKRGRVRPKKDAGY